MADREQCPASATAEVPAGNAGGPAGGPDRSCGFPAAFSGGTLRPAPGESFSAGESPGARRTRRCRHDDRHDHRLAPDRPLRRLPGLAPLVLGLRDVEDLHDADLDLVLADRLADAYDAADGRPPSPAARRAAGRPRWGARPRRAGGARWPADAHRLRGPPPSGQRCPGRSRDCSAVVGAAGGACSARRGGQRERLGTPRADADRPVVPDDLGPVLRPPRRPAAAAPRSRRAGAGPQRWAEVDGDERDARRRWRAGVGEGLGHVQGRDLGPADVLQLVADISTATYSTPYTRNETLMPGWIDRRGPVLEAWACPGGPASPEEVNDRRPTQRVTPVCPSESAPAAARDRPCGPLRHRDPRQQVAVGRSR